MYAIYIPLIRRQVNKFLRLWNCHKIRKQANRPFLPTGKPISLYRQPLDGAKDYRLLVNQRTLKDIQQPVSAFGMRSETLCVRKLIDYRSG
jgi:hypothetical protein